MKNIEIDFQFASQAKEALASAHEIASSYKTPTHLTHPTHPIFSPVKLFAKIQNAYQNLYHQSGKGNEFLGWVNLPLQIQKEELQSMQKKAEYLQKNSEIFVCLGIGGSYLGARAVIEALKPQLSLRKEGVPRIIYAGHHLSEDYMSELLELLDHHDYSLCVISKSGTTTEPAIAFRLLRNHLEKKYGRKQAGERIVAITDASKGALKQLADKEGYTTYVVPDNVGGRYSILTPVGLFPLAVEGIQLEELIKGAISMQNTVNQEIPNFKTNPCLQYVWYRQFFYQQDKKIELMVHYDPRLFYFSEWWKQLYGESEGKNHKGLFPCNAGFTTDLHSLGQYIQEGERLFIETVLSIEEPNTHLEIPIDKENLDGMNFVAGKRISYVNAKAEEGTCMAHAQKGGVPVLRIKIPRLNEFYIGQLIYFFEFACGVSGYTLDINPFDQPGVEAYKKNMFQLLGK
ncbi:MAG: glucose-6-phosphate isomerase [Bacteroidales bacterium]